MKCTLNDFLKHGFRMIVHTHVGPERCWLAQHSLNRLGVVSTRGRGLLRSGASAGWDFRMSAHILMSRCAKPVAMITVVDEDSLAVCGILFSGSS